ncbi:MAG: hypothetical protein EOP82_09480 [Variovorax sp.]|nr:MAG: hypothetical protein EOP82_09480 [Variovorax sp.]
METSSKYAHIQGWGADLDPAQRPAYPKERNPPRLEGVHWNQPPPQSQHIEVLLSTEYESRPPLFGTGPAPAGLSGLIRRYAFGFSENDLRHWLLLLFADRVDVGEGIVADLRAGHVPRIYAEMGGPAELRHNPGGAARKAVVLGAVLGLGYLALRRKARHRQLR